MASKVHICQEDNAWEGSMSQVWLGLCYLCSHFIGWHSATWSHLIVRVWKHCPTLFFWPISPPSPYKEVIVLADLETIFTTFYLHYVYFCPRKSVLCSEWSAQFLTSRIFYCNNNKTQLASLALQTMHGWERACISDPISCPLGLKAAGCSNSIWVLKQNFFLSG